MTSATQVSLTSEELTTGALAGIQRHVDAIINCRKPTYGSDASVGWQQNIEGALCEQAVAKHLGLYYRGKGDFLLPDVHRYQVRSSMSHRNRLILHDEDSNYDVFIFVTGLNGAYVIRGWLYGYEGKQRQYWTDPVGGRPAYFIPQHHLHPLSTLPQL